MGVAADPDAGVRDALAAATRAVELDPASSRAHFALSTAFIQLNDHDRSLDEARLAVELNPNDPTVLHALGNKSDLVGDPQGIGRMEFAQKLNPRDPVMHVWLTFLARAFVNARDHGRAAEKARAAILRRPDYGPAHLMLAIALAHQGRTGEAAAALGQCETVAPGLAASRLGWRPYTDDTSNEHLRGGLRKAITAVDTG